jgi:hypothetical protein
MALTETAELKISNNPDRLIVVMPGIKAPQARRIANEAVKLARRNAPKLTGDGARRMQPIYGKGFYGIYFGYSYMWFQEQGIRAFTMNNLAGKTIPMWVDDPTGQERVKNPKAKTRITASGKVQVLIFRRAAQKGQYKTVKRRSKVSGEVTEVRVPMSWPGAPGRIGLREARSPRTRPGKVAGQIARQNVGVRWRHPGLSARLFMNHALTIASGNAGFTPTRLYAADAKWRAKF